MHTCDIYHTQGITGYQVQHTNFEKGVVQVMLEKSRTKSSCCDACGSTNVRTRLQERREIKGLRTGTKHVVFDVPVTRVDCLDCGRSCREALPFVNKWARHTKVVERTVIELRPEMSISAIANWMDMDRRTIKEIEKEHLAKKFRRIKLRNVRVIGIDEIYIGKAYKTIVRDLESGAVLHVGDGKGGDALEKFERRLRSSRCEIERVAMDMSAGFAAWVERVLPNAELVFDHFHLIKLMNDKLNTIRRRTMKQLDDDSKKQLKNKRGLLLRNEEDLNHDEQQALGQLKETFDDLGTAHAMKEQLRSIYRTAETDVDARVLLTLWVAAATSSTVPELRIMAKTITRYMEGILGYWKGGQLTNAGMEGFNNKVRWLVRQAYGYRDQDYLDLKIFDLPTCTTTKKL